MSTGSLSAWRPESESRRFPLPPFAPPRARLRSIREESSVFARLRVCFEPDLDEDACAGAVGGEEGVSGLSIHQEDLPAPSF